jgi:pimeloyl-ACP methyl ester carboxylesterase
MWHCTPCQGRGYTQERGWSPQLVAALAADAAGVMAAEALAREVMARLKPLAAIEPARMHDEHDREVPVACGRQFAEAWPGARLEVIRGFGHVPSCATPRWSSASCAS